MSPTHERRARPAPSILAALPACAAVLAFCGPIARAQVPLTIVSLGDHGQLGDADSDFATLSPNGRYVVFCSSADNLVPGDTNALDDIFLRDLHAGTIQLVTVSSTGVQSDWNTYQSAVASNGIVAFASYANNLVPGDTANQVDVFLHDPRTGQTQRISYGWNGQSEANGYSYDPSISADGNRVVFRSDASNLVPGDTNHADDIFLWDRITGQTSRISVTPSGGQSNGIADLPWISADGRWVAFLSGGTDLVPGDTNGVTDVFLRDLQNGTTERISVSSAGVQGNGACDYPCFVSSDGRYVVFGSAATNLVAGDSNGVEDVFLRDRAAGTTVRLSVGTGGFQALGGSGNGTLSRDGRMCFFASGAPNLVAGDTNGSQYDVFARDRWLNQTSAVSVDANGHTGVYESFDYTGALSEDGGSAVFHTRNAFAPADTNVKEDVYLADLRVPTGTPFCFGSGTGTPCPCGNSGSSGHGCQNSAGIGGGALEAWGHASISVDSLSFRASYLPSSVVGLLFQGDQTANGGAGVVLGDGVRCAGGSLVRLGLHSALGGVTLYGFAVGDPRISSAGGVTAGGTYEYQVWYRDPTPYCTNATSNLTNAVEIVWQP